MLAVSGSVEAARAGESGRGFAVVSSDIRSLAREASESVERIKDTVRGILDQINSLRRDLEQIIATAEIEVQSNRAIFARAGEARRRRRLSCRRPTAPFCDGADGILAAAVRDRRRRAADRGRGRGSQRRVARRPRPPRREQARGAEDLAAAIEEIASLADELKQPNG